MSLLLVLLGSFLVVGQLVRKWTAPVILAMSAWIAIVVAVHFYILR